MYAQLLMRQGKSDRARLDEAERIAERVEQLETERQAGKGAFGTVELRARLLEARGQGDKAVDLLRAYANRRDARPDDVLLLVARWAGRGVSPTPSTCARRRTCLRNVLRPWAACARRCCGPCRTPTGAARSRGTWLEEAIEKNPKLVVLKMHLADLYDLRGDYPKAEDEYREMLKDEPGNVVALNNLAWLLSQQTGQGAEALQYIEAAVNGIGRRADLLDTRGSVGLAWARRSGLADFTEAVNDAPTGTRLFHLARRSTARDREAAVKTLQKAKADFGLQPSSVHPTEQQFCQTLMTELKVR